MLGSKKEYQKPQPQKTFIREVYEPGYIREVLRDLGFNNVADTGTYFRAKAIYRKGDALSFSINKTTGIWSDYKTKQWGNLKELPGLFGPRGSEVGIKSGDITPRKPNIPTPVKFWEPSVIKNLLPIYDFYMKKGISEKTLRLFKAGYTNKTDLKNRIIFSVFASNGKICGFAGRDVTGKSQIKWKILSKKSLFVYPIYTVPESHQMILDKKELYLVESIGDLLSMWEQGIKNVIVLFGTDLSQAIINYLVSVNPNVINISLNNEKSGIGNEACIKNLIKLTSFFDINKLRIKPTLLDKDFGDFRGDDFKIWEKTEIDTHKLVLDYLKKKQYLLPRESKLLESLK